MNEQVFYMIDSYLDGELNHEDEEALFGQLADNADARDYFRKVNIIRTQTEAINDEFPPLLEQRILERSHKKRFFKFSESIGYTGTIAAAVSVILLVISLFLLNEVSDYRNEINSALNQLNKQNLMIETLYNSLPATIVQAEYSNEIIIKPKI